MNDNDTLRYGYLTRISFFFLIGCGVFAGLKSCYWIYLSLEPESIYRKDLFQNYLMARATQHGLSPYLSIQNLADHFGFALSSRLFPHPSPHPISILPFIYWLSWFDYETSARLWVALEIVILAITVVLSLRLLDWQLKPAWMVVCIMCCLGASFVEEEIILGQFSILSSFFIVLFFLLTRSKKLALAGIPLGACISLKFFGLLFLPMLVINKNWRTPLVAGLVFLLLSLSAVWLTSWNELFNYFTNVLPHASDHYTGTTSNRSLWTIADRLFTGTSPFLQPESIEVEPLLVAPLVARILQTVIGICLVYILILAWWRKKYWSLLLLTTSISPVSWTHYFSLLTPFLTKLAKAGQTSLPIQCLLLFFYTQKVWTTSIPNKEYSFFEGLPQLFPNICVLILLIWVWRKDTDMS